MFVYIRLGLTFLLLLKTKHRHLGYPFLLPLFNPRLEVEFLEAGKLVPANQ
jgi:hypothetical protein